jgi:tetratricopeptide (TPR) repeat protein
MADGLGPAAVAVPVGWAADALANLAQRWFRRIRRVDDLSRLVQAAGISARLSGSEFESVRRLLEGAEAWQVLGRGTVEDLAALIASCMPPGDGRSTEDSHAMALAIARGMLEFAVFNLEPGMFQRVLLVRMQRMETSQATALDEALLRLHADLAAGFGDVVGQLGRVLDRLPPGPAGRGEVAVYLKTMIGWLNSDPWPGHRRFGGPVLTPADIERRLRVTASGKDLDADELAGQCRRLVILGGPGSGKTWFARRTARRCAEEALQAMAAGATVQEVELPLYTTCSRLQVASGDIRMAAVSSALDQLGDLGGSRISAALRVLFTERNEPTLLVTDSLDEAPGSGERLRQADTLPWRVVLTSRPSSWDRQLVIASADDSGQIGELQPLRYPDDVDPFIRSWFSVNLGRGEELVAQIARRPDLQKAATVPLILAFYCIVGDGQPLPELWSDLYAKVLRRLLTGRWRAERGPGPDPDACLATLQTWAWSAAVTRPISRVGAWAEDFPSPPSQLSAASSDAADNVAVPLNPPDIDTGHTIRRFIHRTIREYLVAAYVAELPAEEAAEALLPHLWYDPDWEYAAPTALAMHRQRDELLIRLIQSAARSGDVPDDLSVIDAGWEFRAFLARVAAQSDQARWQPGTAQIISQARVDLAMAARTTDLMGAACWEASNCRVREALLTVLADTADTGTAITLADALAALQPTDEERSQACEALLILLVGTTSPRAVGELIRAATQLSTTAEERSRVREALLTVLADTVDTGTAITLADALVALQPTDEERSRAGQALTRLLAGVNMLQGQAARQLMYAADRLAPTAGILRLAREGLLSAMADTTESWAAMTWADAVIGLQPTPEEHRQVREILLTLLPGTTGPETAAELVNMVVRLQPTAEEQSKVFEDLLTLLADTTYSETAGKLAHTVAGLARTAAERNQAREVLLTVLASTTDNWAASKLADAVAEIAVTAEERNQAREVLFTVLASTTLSWTAAGQLTDSMATVATTAEERSRTREVLLTVLARTTDGATARTLADAMAELQPTAEQRNQAREILLTLLASTTHGGTASTLADAMAELHPTAEQRNQAHEVLLTLLASTTDGATALYLARSVAQLEPTAEEYSRTREVLLTLLAGTIDGATAFFLTTAVAELQPTAEERSRTREVLLTLLAGTTDAEIARELAYDLARHQPVARDLGNWRTWATPPPPELLAATRQESALTDWLTILPDLRSLPGRTIDPSDSWAITRRGRTHEQMGRYQEALADFSRAIDIDPNDSWPIRLRGRTYEQIGRYDEALADFSRAIDIDPNDSSAITSRGDLCRLMGRYDEALADFSRAIDIDPSNSPAVTSRGLTYQMMGRYDEALADFSQAIAIDPNNSLAITLRSRAEEGGQID